MEILPDLTSNKQDARADQDEDLIEPINLADYSIAPPSMPSEQEQKEECLDYFQKHLCEKYQLRGQFALKKAVEIIEDFEEKQKSSNPDADEFAFLDDRFNENLNEGLLNALAEHLFGTSDDEGNVEKAEQFLQESSSYMLIKRAQLSTQYTSMNQSI